MISIGGYSIAACLHAVGTVLLYLSKGELPNQRLVTMNLAIAEMLFCLLVVIYHIVDSMRLLQTPAYIISMHYFILSLFCSIRFAILHIIVDRFLNIWLHLKYPLYFNRKTLIKTIILEWILSLFVAFVVVLLLNFRVKYTSIFARLFLDLMIIIVALATFVYLFVKVKEAIYGNLPQQNRQYRSSQVWFKLKIPVLMVATYIAFNTSSSILYARNKQGIAFIVLDIFGWWSDAFIYILLQKSVRRMLFSCCWRKNRNQVEDTCMTTIA